MRVSVRLVLAAFAVAGLVLPSGAAAWTWPVDGPVLRPFSFGSDPYAAGQHRGIDIGSPTGSTVVAPAGGTVSFAGTVPTGGKTVTILTPTGYAATLVHLGSIRVLRGTTIEEGSAVGTVGPSGVPDIAEPYVYLGIRVASDDQGYLDPLLFLPPRPQLPAPPAAVDPAPAPVAEAPAPAEQAPLPDATVAPPPAEAPAPEPAADPASAPAPSASDEPAAPAADGDGAASDPGAAEPAGNASSSDGADASVAAPAPASPEPAQVDEAAASEAEGTAAPPASAETAPSGAEAETTLQPGVEPGGESGGASAEAADDWARPGAISAEPPASSAATRVVTFGAPPSRARVPTATTAPSAAGAARHAGERSPNAPDVSGVVPSPIRASHVRPTLTRARLHRPSLVRHRREPTGLARTELKRISMRRAAALHDDVLFPLPLALISILCGVLVAAALVLRRRRTRPGTAPAGAEAARMMVIRGGAEAKTNPGGACVAVRGGPSTPGTRDRIRGPGRHLRALPPTPGERGPDGERDGRAWDARDGGRGQRGHLAA
jgi:hypothetical protein